MPEELSTNPFNSYLDLCSNSESQESELFESTRTARLETQLAQLHASLKFNQDPVLYRRLACPDFSDPRHSLIFIARPPLTLARQLGQVQKQIVEAFDAIGMHEIWSTPSECLHMTVLDLLSCVSSAEIAALATKVTPANIVGALDSHNVAPAVFQSPKLMTDASAIAITFLGTGYLRLRSALWQGAVADGNVPVMRYVAISAHVTLTRYLQDVQLSSQQMKGLLVALQRISLDFIDDWKIDKGDIKCVHGQVYYGGGDELK